MKKKDDMYYWIRRAIFPTLIERVAAKVQKWIKWQVRLNFFW